MELRISNFAVELQILCWIGSFFGEKVLVLSRRKDFIDKRRIVVVDKESEERHSLIK